MLVFFDGCGEWFVLGNGPYAGMGLDDECISAVRIVGIFELPRTNEMEIKYSGSSLVKNLLPCYTHEDGVICDGYTDKDDIYFKLHVGLGFDKALGRAAYLGKVFNTQDVIREYSDNLTEEPTSQNSNDEDTATNIDNSVQVDKEKTVSNVKKKRNSQLHSFIWRVREHLLESQSEKVTALMVWREIKSNYKEYDSDGIIQEVTVDKISWVSFDGCEGSLARTSFSSAISKLKNTPPF